MLITVDSIVTYNYFYHQSSSTSNYFTKMTRSRTKQNESLEFVSPGPKVASLPLIHRDNVLVNHQSPWRGKVNQVDRQQR